ncbi:serine protease 55-like protein, partial [Dinothrombium tinctorium]
MYQMETMRNPMHPIVRMPPVDMMSQMPKIENRPNSIPFDDNVNDVNLVPKRTKVTPVIVKNIYYIFRINHEAKKREKTNTVLSKKSVTKSPDLEPLTRMSKMNTTLRKEKHGKCFVAIPECGKRKQQLTGEKTLGGRIAMQAEFPWHVSIQLRNGKSFYHICSGALILFNWIITAASCVHR